MKNLKNQKGITLVALVVTIIVLLILTGVSLSLVAGSNGIITRASNAKNTNTDATAKEQVTLMIAEWTSDLYEAKYVTKTESVNKDPGTWIMETYPGTESGEDQTVDGKTKKAHKTTDNYNFYIDSTLVKPNGKEDEKDKNYYKVTITGTLIKDSTTKRTANNGLDKRLSEDITGKLTVDGKLTWD